MMTTPQENAALVGRFLSDVVAGGDTAAVDIFLAEDVTDHNLVFENSPDQEELIALGWRVLAAADVEVDIKDVIATGDGVAVRATVSGIHRESLIDLAPTGRSFEIAYVWFCRIVHGRIAEIWSLPDGLGLMQQLGVLPELSSNRSSNESTRHPE